MKTIRTQLARGYARWARYLTTMEGAEVLVVSSGIPFHLWRLYQHFWLVCLLFPIVSLVQTPLPPARLFLALAALVFFAVSYTWLMWPHPASSGARKRSRSPASLILFGVLVALVLALCLLYGNSFLWLFIGISAIAGVTLPMRSAFVAVVIFTLLPLGISVGASGGIARVDWLQIIPLMLLVRGIGKVIAEVARGDEVLPAALSAHPDVALLDIEMPGGGGLPAAQALREYLPSCRVVILTTFGRSGYLRRAMDSGAVGFLLKDAPATELAVAIRSVMEGERVVDPDLALAALSEGNNPLTNREREVLSVALSGISIADIAAQLYLSEGTVRNHLSIATQKLGARNRMETARLAEQKGWL